ncbi:MAG: outer membrane lipoprotein-sorting protein [Deltaproteobacteria bacterium]|nr:outer membrane lipoprotein-sorting protein [Deltaproteobacteria bacterium]
MRLLPSLLLAAALAVPVTAATAEDIDPQALLTKIDDAGRSDSSTASVTMHVKTKRYERTMKMQNWTQGTERSLIKILEPAKDAGITVLKVDDNLWNYLPNTDRTMKVPGAMMSGAWMGSHLTNDDLVRETRFSEDYTFTLGTSPNEGQALIVCTPKPDAPVPWGKVEVVAELDGVPVKQVFYDEDGEAVRALEFSDIREINGTRVAMSMKVVPYEKPGEFTEFRFDELILDAPVDASLFSLQALGK